MITLIFIGLVVVVVFGLSPGSGAIHEIFFTLTIGFIALCVGLDVIVSKLKEIAGYLKSSKVKPHTDE